MARINSEGQWILLLGLAVSAALFTLAILLNESVLVGKSTAENVIDFPKGDILDIRSEAIKIFSAEETGVYVRNDLVTEVIDLSSQHKNAIVSISGNPSLDNTNNVNIRFFNGLIDYNEVIEEVRQELL